ERTRVVAFALASNATGSVADAKRICGLARDAGAISWIDAVHFAAHEPIDVQELGCDVLLCSPYKFCGPHLGIAYVRRELAETWRPYKARPSKLRFETGTLPYELLAGFSATIAYLDSIGGLPAIRDHERELGTRFLAGLPEGVTLYGPPTMEGRVPTFLLNVDGAPAGDVARRLGARGGRPAARRARTLPPRGRVRAVRAARNRPTGWCVSPLRTGETLAEALRVEDRDPAREVEQVPVAADEDRPARRRERDQVAVSGVRRPDGRRFLRIFRDGRGLAQPAHDPVGLIFRDATARRKTYRRFRRVRC